MVLRFGIDQAATQLLADGDGYADTTNVGNGRLIDQGVLISHDYSSPSIGP